MANSLIDLPQIMAHFSTKLRLITINDGQFLDRLTINNGPFLDELTINNGPFLDQLTVNDGPFLDGGDHADFKSVGELHLRVLTSVTRVVTSQILVHRRNKTSD